MNSCSLLSSPVNYTLRKKTVPMMFGLIMQMSFNIIDTLYVGMLGTQSLAAFSFTFSVTFALISLAIGLGIGVGAVVGKATGQENQCLAKQHAMVALFLSLTITCFVAIIGLIFLKQIFSLLGARGLQLELISDYMTPWLVGSFFVVLPIIGNSVIRASGNTKTPAQIMALGAGFNIILDPVFIFGLGPIPEMGIAGAAIATVIANALGCIFVCYKLSFSYRLLGWGYSFQQVRESAIKILKAALPAAASNMMIPISSAILITMVANYGDEAVAAFGVGKRIESIAIILILALSMSLSPFVSQNFGANQLYRVKQAYFSGIKFVLVWQMLIYILLCLSADSVANWFANEPEVANLISAYLVVIPVTHGLVGMAVLSNCTLNALQKSSISLRLNIFRLFWCLLPCAYIGSSFGGIEGVIIGIVCATGVSGLVSFYFMLKELNKLELGSVNALQSIDETVVMQVSHLAQKVASDDKTRQKPIKKRSQRALVYGGYSYK